MSNKNIGINNKNCYSVLSGLINWIRDNNLKKGDRLPNEEELASKFYTCRSSLREVLRILEAMGVIESVRGSGNVIVKDITVGLCNLMIVYSVLEKEKESVREFCMLRAFIESQAVEAFIQNAEPVDYYKLQFLCQEYLGDNVDKSSEDYFNHHTQFHAHIMKFLPFSSSLEIINSHIKLSQLPDDRQIDYNNLPNYEKAEASSHERLVQVIMSKDIEAAKNLIIDHVMVTTQNDFINS